MYILVDCSAMEVAKPKTVFDRLGPKIVGAAARTKQPQVCHNYQSGQCHRKNSQYLHLNLMENAIQNGMGKKRGRQLLDHENHQAPVLRKPRKLNGIEDNLAARDNVAQLSVSKPRIVPTQRQSFPASANEMRPLVKNLKASICNEAIAKPAIKTILKPANGFKREMRPFVNKLKAPICNKALVKPYLKTIPQRSNCFKSEMKPFVNNLKAPVRNEASPKPGWKTIPKAASPLKACPSPINASNRCMTSSCDSNNGTSSFVDVRSKHITPDSSACSEVVDAIKLCEKWVEGNCPYGEKCKNKHSWFDGEDFTLVASLNGHQKSVTGIALPAGSNKLYSGSEDGTVRVWDCHTGQCIDVANMGGEVGCLISEGEWVFIGSPNMVKVFNHQSKIDVSLPVSAGQVYCLKISYNIIFAGTKDGSILVWKFNDAGKNIDTLAPLLGHDLAVVTLIVGAGRLYSGSLDTKIKVWDAATFFCLFTLTDHTSPVTSVLCWDRYLLSCSLDNTIRVWSTVEDGTLKVVHKHTEEDGLLGLSGTHDSKGESVVLCSCKDKSVKLYSLPSFSQRGKMFSKGEVLSLQAGPEDSHIKDLFFTGDEAGQIKVWRWLSEDDSQTASANI